MLSKRVFFHVQNLLGIGHIKRAAAIAGELDARGFDVCIAFGGLDVPTAEFGRARVVRLAGAKSRDAVFSAIVDAGGRVIDDAWKEARRTALLNAFDDFAADLLMVELYPFGRRSFRFELAPLVARANERGVPVICSVRDVLVAPKHPERVRAAVDTLCGRFDAVLVHGDERIIPFGDRFPLIDEIAHLIEYTGYVSPPPAATPGTDGAGEIIVSSGGGAFGEPLMRAAIEAKRMGAGGARSWRMLIGPNTEAGLAAELQSQLPPDMIIEPARPDFTALLGRCALSVSQAGYNTMMNLLAVGCRALVVPFDEEEENEQMYRALRVEKLGGPAILPGREMTPESLATAIDGALAGQPVAAHGIDMGGIEKTAAWIERRLNRDG